MATSDAGENEVTPIAARDNSEGAPYVARMILAAGQYYFWYFGYPTPLAPAEDRSA
jgi:hypothetical protein